MGLKDIGSTLPPGFRFYPSDEELVCHYLHKKITNEDVLKGTLVEIDLHTCEPWQLPEVAKLNSKEWYFFSFRDRKYATGYRTNRATISGYWKATGKDRLVLDPQTRGVVGMRKTLVFYRNRAPNGIKTAWIMHEFRLENPNTPPKEDWVLCRVFQKAKSENSHRSTSPDQYSDNIPQGGAANWPGNFLQFPSSSKNPVPDQLFENPNQFLNIPMLDNDMNLPLSPDQELNKLDRSHPLINSTKSDDDDQFGFLFDMNFQEANILQDTAPSTLDIISEEDHNTNSTFF